MRKNGRARAGLGASVRHLALTRKEHATCGGGETGAKPLPATTLVGESEPSERIARRKGQSASMELRKRNMNRVVLA